MHTVENGQVTISDSEPTDGDTATTVCNGGHILQAAGSETIGCSSSGVWDTPLPICEGIG